MGRNYEINSLPDSKFTGDNIAESASPDEQLLLEQSVLKLSGNILGFVLGVLFGLLIFFATIWLVLRGGTVVGPHLGLLGNYFFGYSVSLAGSFVGMAYGFVAGYLSGLVIARTYNAVVAMTARRNH